MIKRLALAASSTALALVLIGLVARHVSPIAAAEGMPQRMIQVPVVTKNVPLVVFRATLGTLGDATVQAGRFAKPGSQAPDQLTPFEAGFDWVQQTTVYFLNRTQRSLTWAYITFTFSDTNAGPQQFRLYLGIPPGTAATDPKFSSAPSGGPLGIPMGKEPLLVRPGDLLEIRLGDRVAQIDSQLDPHVSLGAATKMAVDVQACYFGPDVLWAGNHFRVRDLESNTWQDADRSYFPGDMDRRLPGLPGWPEQ